MVRLNADGVIADGGNDNEHTWRLTDEGKLEFVQRDGRVHSRFSLDRAAHGWTSSKTPDLLQKTPEQSLTPGPP
jgi:DNA-binding transcriptional regulator PaaX